MNLLEFDFEGPNAVENWQLANSADSQRQAAAGRRIIEEQSLLTTTGVSHKTDLILTGPLAQQG